MRYIVYKLRHAPKDGAGTVVMRYVVYCVMLRGMEQGQSSYDILCHAAGDRAGTVVMRYMGTMSRVGQHFVVYTMYIPEFVTAHTMVSHVPCVMTVHGSPYEQDNGGTWKVRIEGSVKIIISWVIYSQLSIVFTHLWQSYI